MKYNVINLEYAKDRLENIKKYFENNKLNFDVFKAVDGIQLSLNEKFFHPYFLSRNSLYVLQNYKGSIACSLSHILLWEKIIKSNTDDIHIILEDDVKFDNLFEHKITFFLNKIPDDWDVLYLGRKYLTGKIVNKYFVKGNKTNQRGYNVSSYGYVVKRKGCKKLLKLSYPLLNIEQDMTLRQNQDKYNAYFLIEPIVFHENFKSCINMNNDVYR